MEQFTARRFQSIREKIASVIAITHTKQSHFAIFQHGYPTGRTEVKQVIVLKSDSTIVHTRASDR